MPHCPPLLRPTTMKSNKTNNTHTKAATTTTTWIRSTATNKKTIPLCKIHPLVSLGPPSRRRYCDASGSLGKFRRRDSAAKVRSDTVAVAVVAVSSSSRSSSSSSRRRSRSRSRRSSSSTNNHKCNLGTRTFWVAGPL